MKTRIMIVFIVMLSAVFILGDMVFACDGKKDYSKAGKAEMTTDAEMASAKLDNSTVMLNVSNMTGASSATRVTKTLAAVDGVNDVKVNLGKGTAEVSYDAKKVKPEMLMAAVVKAGYPTTMAEAAPVSDKSGCDPAACAGMKSAMKEACSDDMKTADSRDPGSPDNQ